MPNYIKRKTGEEMRTINFMVTTPQYEIIVQKASEEHRSLASYIKSKVFQ